ncbi:MAG: hypothetical protein HKN47_22060 [Pirellulaceae bacterium]|nr:hypothetical protein [Pirellulaceae bacterium]
MSDPFGGGDTDPFGGGKSVPTRRPAARRPVANAAATPKAQVNAQAQAPVSDVEARLQALLSDETTQTFINTPLNEALETVSRTHDIPIVLDRRALEEVGLTPDVPVTLSLKNVSLRSFMRLMLRGLQLTYMIKDEVLQITTVEVAQRNLIVKMHIFPKSLISKTDQIVRALQSTVQPATWDISGGPSSVVPIENVMAISATADVHDDVAEFLIKLEAAYEKSKSQNK